MGDRRDIVEFGGVPVGGKTASGGGGQLSGSKSPSKFLSVWFRCCHTYGRMYRNRAQTRYEGRCPRCGAAVHARIGPGGTSQRTFEAR